tara:strand:- start:172 stop:597 length:426 start_codon:yes stop_codon:yes gene_type:complete
VSGETTSGGLVRLPTILKEHNPKIIIIELGGNDALRGYPIDIIRDNLTNLVYLGKKFGCAVIIAGMRIPPNYGIKYTQAFENVFAEIARDTNTALLPFLLSDISIGNGFVQNDGIHPTKKAQPILLKNIWPYVLNAIEEAT